ncbi:MAG: HlyD family secretion protein, partial [Longimicrobiales bacterium]
DSAFAGRVVHIASEAEFTPRNVQTEEERVKLVYAVKVQIVGDDAVALKPGVPADVILSTRD